LSTGKYGGTVTVVYNVTIIGGAGSSNVLSTLIYDFSGSSYHYNADFSTSARIANIVGPSTVTIAKRFVPDSIAPGGTSQLMFTLNNPTAVSIAGVVFSDTLPSGVTVAGTPAISYTGCGSGAFSPVPTGGTGTLNFQNGTIAPNSSCSDHVQQHNVQFVHQQYDQHRQHRFRVARGRQSGRVYAGTINGDLVCAERDVQSA
jgi:uncharacterized repeat protein (TIGR01451 family)